VIPGDEGPLSDIGLPAFVSNGVRYNHTAADGSYKIEVISPDTLTDIDYETQNHAWGNGQEGGRWHGSSYYIVKNSQVYFGPNTDPDNMDEGGFRVTNFEEYVESAYYDDPYIENRKRAADSARGVSVYMNLAPGDYLMFIVNELVGTNSWYSDNRGGVTVQICYQGERATSSHASSTASSTQTSAASSNATSNASSSAVSSASSQSSTSRSSSVQSASSASSVDCKPPYWNVCDVQADGSWMEYRFPRSESSDTVEKQVKDFLSDHPSANVGGCPVDTSTRWTWQLCLGGQTKGGDWSDMLKSTPKVKEWLAAGATLGACKASECDFVPHCDADEYAHYQSQLMDIPYSEASYSASSLPALFDLFSVAVHPIVPVYVDLGSNKVADVRAEDYQKVYVLGFAPEDEMPTYHLTNDRLNLEGKDFSGTTSIGEAEISYNDAQCSGAIGDYDPIDITRIVKLDGQDLNAALYGYFYDVCPSTRSHTKYFVTAVACVTGLPRSSSASAASASSAIATSASASSASASVASEAVNAYAQSAASAAVVRAASSVLSLPSFTRCGDGIRQDPEGCDDGNQESGDGCAANCTLESCGNGKKEPGEECDDGNQINVDACTALCRLPRCGDSFVQGREECDDGPYNSEVIADACRTNCMKPRCGDGVIDTREDCDDGNLRDGDGCTVACVDEVCGNGIADAGEECDDGNQDDADGCSNACRKPFCGDGVVSGSEECDDGASNSNLRSNACRKSCKKARVGDGVIDFGEQCDDGNEEDGDGCSVLGVVELEQPLYAAAAASTASPPDVLASVLRSSPVTAVLTPPNLLQFPVIAGAMDHRPVGDTGPAAVAVMAAGGAAGWAFMRRRR
jgi:cysteine-rich repeat protein